MIRKIRIHNIVNGFAFSVIEFALIAIIVAPFAYYYFTHARYGAGTVAAGIAANALVFVTLALQSLIAGERDLGVSNWFTAEGRSIINERYPNITQDTLILTTVTLVPFLLLAAILWDALHSPGPTA